MDMTRERVAEPVRHHARARDQDPRERSDGMRRSASVSRAGRARRLRGPGRARPADRPASASTAAGCRRRVARRARRVAGRAGLVRARGGRARRARRLGAGWLLTVAALRRRSRVEVSGQSRLTPRGDRGGRRASRPGSNLFTLDTRRGRRAASRRCPSCGTPRWSAACRTASRSRWRSGGPSRSSTRAGCTGSTSRACDLGPETRAVALGTPGHQRPRRGRPGGRRGRWPPSARPGSACCGCSCARRELAAQQISEIDVSRPEGPVLYTLDGVEVRLGKEDWEARLGRLARRARPAPGLRRDRDAPSTCASATRSCCKPR